MQGQRFYCCIYMESTVSWASMSVMPWVTCCSCCGAVTSHSSYGPLGGRLRIAVLPRWVGEQEKPSGPGDGTTRS